MRPIKAGPYAPVTASATAFNTSSFTSTGAAVAPTTTVTPDNLSHNVTLTAPVQATLAGITFTLVGIDANGHAVTETGLVGPASGATVTSAKYYKTLSSIQPSATMGGLVVSVGIGATSLSPVIPTDQHSMAPAAAVVEIVAGSTINYTGSETFDNVFSLIDTPLYTPNTNLTSKTATQSSQLLYGTAGFAVLTNSVTNGAQYYMRVSQGDSLA
jgi:hypothetical protein